MLTSRRSNRKLLKSKNLPRPEIICKEILGHFPNWKKQIGFALSQKGKTLPNWPEYIFAPLSAYFQFAFDGMPNPLEPNFREKVLQVQTLTALIPWSLSKGIYEFSDELFNTLFGSEIPNKIPSEILKKFRIGVSIFLSQKKRERNIVASLYT